jgi:hypothetical protein
VLTCFSCAETFDTEVLDDTAEKTPTEDVAARPAGAGAGGARSLSMQLPKDSAMSHPACRFSDTEYLHYRKQVQATAGGA